MQTLTVKSVSVTTITIISTRELTASEASQLSLSPPARRGQLFGAVAIQKRKKKLATSRVGSKRGDMKQW